jgi:hypothetical protein
VCLGSAHAQLKPTPRPAAVVPPQAEDVELEQLQEEHEAARALVEQAYDGGLGGYDPILLEPELEEEFGAGEPATPPQIAMKMKVKSARWRRAAVGLLPSSPAASAAVVLHAVGGVGRAGWGRYCAGCRLSGGEGGPEAAAGKRVCCCAPLSRRTGFAFSLWLWRAQSERPGSSIVSFSINLRRGTVCLSQDNDEDFNGNEVAAKLAVLQHDGALLKKAHKQGAQPQKRWFRLKEGEAIRHRHNRGS